ncbi:MAG: SufD family Fe-S cluster assembly protein [Bacteroidales bacterium]|nr:SufD family Fe-S cluster assembly protein [Bacteroidales bacterium]
MDRIVIGSGLTKSEVVLLRGGETRSWDITVGGGASFSLAIVALPGACGDAVRPCAGDAAALPAGGKSIDCDIAVRFDGEGGECQLRGLYLAGGSSSVNIKVNMVHNLPNCTSRQMFKGILSGEARTQFFGLINVPEKCIGTEAYQENHNLLLSDTCRAQSLPQLEIYADDVKCSHGATFGRLNADELFYMRSRGIPEGEARRLQMVAFAGAVLEGLPDDIVAAALAELARLV